MALVQNNNIGCFQIPIPISHSVDLKAVFCDLRGVPYLLPIIFVPLRYLIIPVVVKPVVCLLNVTFFFISAVKDLVPISPEVTDTRPPPPARPPAAPHYQPPLPQPPVNSGGLFSSIRGGAGSFLKNLKDTSSKVMQTVQQ